MPALDGLKVLDLTQYEAGTTSTQYLAWFGATVVKVERPGVGDPGRSTAGPGKDSLYFLTFNHNKRSVAIDLDTPEGRDLFLRLAPRFDVVVENFSLGTMEKLGLGYEVLKTVHPGLIYATVKGFGTYGPYSKFKCFDMVAQAAGGSFSVTGVPEGPPMRPGATFGDTGSGMHCAMGIMAAYIQRQRTGKGQVVEIAMQETIANFMREPMSQR
jgi:formyl-CoA transferase